MALQNSSLGSVHKEYMLKVKRKFVVDVYGTQSFPGGFLLLHLCVCNESGPGDGTPEWGYQGKQEGIWGTKKLGVSMG